VAVSYEWDACKAKTNLTKHGISFIVAAKALDDPYRLEELDLSEDYGEDTSLVLCCYHGMMVVLFVVTTEPEESVCHIISARRANQNEQERYWKNRPLPPRQPAAR
jgi:uncharacterized DUF497 family protein